MDFDLQRLSLYDVPRLSLYDVESVGLLLYKKCLFYGRNLGLHVFETRRFN